MQRRDLKPDGNVRNDYAHSGAPGIALFRGRNAKVALMSAAVTADLRLHFPPPAGAKYQNAQICGIYDERARGQQVLPCAN